MHLHWKEFWRGGDRRAWRDKKTRGRTLLRVGVLNEELMRTGAHVVVRRYSTDGSEGDVKESLARNGSSWWIEIVNLTFDEK